jgi:GAF domain
MDHPSILDQSSASSAAGGEMPGTTASRPTAPSVSAGIAAANAHPPRVPEAGARFPGEDGGQSLAEIACSDLDAALQLLAERAHYITGGSGAAIALRRGEHNDMLCRASAGSNAPELGALLSMEYGLSGESIRTRQAMRCDDAERDPRVNREACRQLGIASVVVMPIVSDDQALGVFQLFSGKPHAFDERDLSALQRLSEMVETAVKYAVAAQTATVVPELPLAESQPPADVAAVESWPVEPVAIETVAIETVAMETVALEPVTNIAAPDSTGAPPLPQEVEKDLPGKTGDEPASKKPLFWSAAMQAPGSAQVDDAAQSTAVPPSMTVPPVLRNLQKCQACGFPVSQGRTLCVECEEKQWRGKRLPQPSSRDEQQLSLKSEVAHDGKDTPGPSTLKDSALTHASSRTEVSAVVKSASPALAGAVAGTPQNAISDQIGPLTIPARASIPFSSSVPSDIPSRLPQNVSKSVSGEAPVSDHSTLFLSSAMQPESWFAANKYVLAALLVVAIVIGAIAWLR